MVDCSGGRVFLLERREVRFVIIWNFYSIGVCKRGWGWMGVIGVLFFVFRRLGGLK